jgi:hypothetical protein
MTDRIDEGAYQIAWPGTTVASQEPMPGAGAWEISDHAGCDADGMLRAFARNTPAPRCPDCGASIRWQLTHLAPSVAADHRGVGHLP